MNRINYKQKAVEFSVGILIGFFILYFMFSKLSDKFSYELRTLGNSVDKNNDLTYKAIEKVDSVDNKVDSIGENVYMLNMKQDHTIEKVHEIENSLQKVKQDIKNMRTENKRLHYRP